MAWVDYRGCIGPGCDHRGHLFGKKSSARSNRIYTINDPHNRTNCLGSKPYIDLPGHTHQNRYAYPYQNTQRYPHPHSHQYTIPTSTPVDIRKAKDDSDIVFVPAGDFMMAVDSNSPYFWGAEAPPHRVYLDGFWIYRTVVTNAMYQARVAEKACPLPEQVYSRTRDPYYGNPDYASYPVVYVNYLDATAYRVWAGGRLPTEAEWEKAARGPNERLFPWGNDLPTADKLNFCDWNCPASQRFTSVDDGYRNTAPVGSYPAGASIYSVLDMAGNVSEWAVDWMGTLYYSTSPESNPLGPSTGTRRVVRGGSWGNPTEGARTVARFSVNPSESLESIGFRCVVDNPAP